MASGTGEKKVSAKLSIIDKMNMLRGMFDPPAFKSSVRPMIYKKANNDPEYVNEIVIKMLKSNSFEMSLLKPFFSAPERLRIEINGQKIIPFGTAAGLDKNGDALGPLSNFFGFLEPGTVVVNARPGNDRPRIYSDDVNLDLYNAQGFPSNGLEYFKNNLIAYKKSGGNVPVYVNICGLPLSEENAVGLAMDEMKNLLKTLEPYADGFVWNCASPNTEALKLLRDPEIFKETAKLMKDAAPNKLRLVKMWPYETVDTDAALKFIASFIDGGGNGVVTTNTKMFPKEQVPTENWGYKSAGRSGKFLQSYRLRSVSDIRKTFPNAVIVATGGIYDGYDAYDTFRAGANMLEGYTPYTFYGLGLLRDIERVMVKELEANGYSTLAQLQSDVKEGKQVSANKV